MAIAFGTQLKAITGYASLRPGIKYYFLGDGHGGSVRLAWFHETKFEWRVFITSMYRAEFEEFVLAQNPTLVVDSRQAALPPWLDAVDGMDFEAIEDQRYRRKKKTARQQVNDRLMKIAPALLRQQEILESEEPLRLLSKIASESTPKVHAFRMQLWFFAYFLHGRDQWSLKSPTHHIGNWKRDDAKYQKKKFGKPALSGSSCFNSPLHEVRERSIDAFAKYAQLGRTQTEIYHLAMIKDFGCKVFTDEHGRKSFIHPENKPFPSFGQFRYAAHKAFGTQRIHQKLYGSSRLRKDAKTYEGTYICQYANLLQVVEVDAYYLKERPTALTHESIGDRIAVAKGICPASGVAVGIGFSLKGENKEAYRSMLFSMAVPKDYLARVYGIDPKFLAEWKSVGLPLNFRSDRGPAGHAGLVDALEFEFPIKSIVPSYSGQSKAIVESSHPRDMHNDESPSYVQSDFSVIELMQREILRAACDNGSRDITNRLTDSDIRAFRKEHRVATPNELWDYLSLRGRSCAIQMSLHQAVRAFWTPCTFDIDQEGVWFRHRPFKSEEFSESGVLRRLISQGRSEIRGYMLTTVVRCIWVEVKGKLMELQAAHRVPGDVGDLYVPLDQLEQAAEELRQLQSQTRIHIKAARVEGKIQFQEMTERDWGQGRRKGGSPPKASGQAALEARAIRRVK